MAVGLVAQIVITRVALADRPVNLAKATAQISDLCLGAVDFRGELLGLGGNRSNLGFEPGHLGMERILLALEIRPDFVSSAPFIPNQNTPLETFSNGSLNVTLNCMAIWRIALSCGATFLFERPALFWIAPRKSARALQPAEPLRWVSCPWSATCGTPANW